MIRFDPLIYEFSNAVPEEKESPPGKDIGELEMKKQLELFGKLRRIAHPAFEDAGRDSEIHDTEHTECNKRHGWGL
ncbi:hypothetical protein LA080_002934 [Diaporthe eres]|nr:hypothetical protein LA080_002934 [Diaporthe eres]